VSSFGSNWRRAMKALRKFLKDYALPTAIAFGIAYGLAYYGWLDRTEYMTIDALTRLRASRTKRPPNPQLALIGVGEVSLKGLAAGRGIGSPRRFSPVGVRRGCASGQLGILSSPNRYQCRGGQTSGRGSENRQRDRCKDRCHFRGYFRIKARNQAKWMWGDFRQRRGQGFHATAYAQDGGRPHVDSV
jgi:hypothetical protein